MWAGRCWLQVDPAVLPVKCLAVGVSSAWECISLTGHYRAPGRGELSRSSPTVLSMGIVWFLLLVGEVSNMMDRDTDTSCRENQVHWSRATVPSSVPWMGKSNSTAFYPGCPHMLSFHGNFSSIFPFSLSPCLFALKKAYCVHTYMTHTLKELVKS